MSNQQKDWIDSIILSLRESFTLRQQLVDIFNGRLRKMRRLTKEIYIKLNRKHSPEKSRVEVHSGITADPNYIR